MVAVKFHGYSDEADRLGDAFFTKYDINKDQGLDKSEYEAVNAQFPSQVRNTPGLPTDNQMRRWSSFDRADTNRDGLVDRVEMGNLVYGVHWEQMVVCRRSGGNDNVCGCSCVHVEKMERKKGRLWGQRLWGQSGQ